jgi:hypothetical protein
MRLTVKHWQRILFTDSQVVDERCCGWQRNSFMLYWWIRQVQDMMVGSMALSWKENNNRMYYIAKEKYDSGRHVVGLVYEGISVLSSYGIGIG